MIERRSIRVLVVYDDLFYFLDKGRQFGLTYEYFKEFEKFVNRTRLKKKRVKLKIVFIPTGRDRLLTSLMNGTGDIAAANLTVTPSRCRLVDFTDPLFTEIDEIVVTGPSSPEIKSLKDLSGKPLFARPESSYYEHLLDLNRIFKKKGLDIIRLHGADPYLEDNDILQMVNAGVLPFAIVDSHVADVWASVMKNITLRKDIYIHSGGTIAWAVRKKSPHLKEILNTFIQKNRKGTLIGNLLVNRYLQHNRWLKNPVQDKSISGFNKTVKLLRNYSDKYEFDWLMVVALAYQESKFNNRKKSSRGAVGIMQIMPSTALDKNVNVKDYRTLEGNIKAGVKYLDFLGRRYFNDIRGDDLNRMLFVLAAYNAGPYKISKVRKKALDMGFNPNIWFGNVEVAASKFIGRETVRYVSNIYCYYIAYRLVRQKQRQRQTYILPGRSVVKEPFLFN